MKQGSNNILKHLQILLICITCNLGCVKNNTFDIPPDISTDNITANTSFFAVKNLYVDQTVQIQEDLIIEGFVVSSDRAGNFFNTLHIQDKITDPTAGFQIEIDLRDNHLFYPIGSKIIVKLKGLYLGKSRGVFKIGGAFSAFGNLVVGRLPATQIEQHLIRTDGTISSISGTLTKVSDLNDALISTLIRVDSVEVIMEEIGLPFAAIKERTERTLIDCNGNTIVMLNSGFSDFQGALLPDGNGSISGILLRENSNFQLVIRDQNDINIQQERCINVPDTMTSSMIFISELADPDNNRGARFVELYNSDITPLSLNGWKLVRYTNANTSISATIELSGYHIDSMKTLVIAPNASEFEQVYGFSPDIAASTNGPADSNGDDTLVLLDPFGTVIDIFGVIGEDGSGTNHEFEDGRALRIPQINMGNSSYTFEEWEIYNDSGEAGTINEPQNAPENYTPGERN